MSSKKKKRVKRKLKKKIKHLLVLLVLIPIICIVFLVSKKIFKENNIIIKEKIYYLASPTPTVELYNYNEEEPKMEKAKEVVRGTKVSSYNEHKEENEQKYLRIKLDNEEYYVLEDNITKKKEDTVMEKEKYVRTSVTVYKNKEDASISSFIKNSVAFSK